MTVKKSIYTGRATFLVHRDEIEKMIEAGHLLTGIYEDKREELEISYAQFTRYVARYITANKHQKGEGSARPEPRTGIETAPEIRPEKRPKPKGFSHDPNSGNDRNDLI